MYETCAFYTFFSCSSLTKALAYQRCIKGCIFDKGHSTPNLYPAWVHFFLGSLNDDYGK
ncbi:hypothetical protein PMEGAPL128_61820 [Priestia megaterium]